MAFDVTSPADLLALQSEQATDPISMGYAAVDGQTIKTLALFNDSDKNVGGETVGALSVRDFLKLADPAEFGANQVAPKIPYVQMIIDAGGFEGLDADITEFLPNLLVVFASQATDTLAGLNAAVRTLSRAEVLFGAGTVIKKTDWFAARDS